jgi:hypothetical protein
MWGGGFWRFLRTWSHRDQREENPRILGLLGDVQGIALLEGAGAAQ